MILKIRSTPMGKHIHFTVFAGAMIHGTLASCGTLVMQADEFEKFKETLFAGMPGENDPSGNRCETVIFETANSSITVERE